YLNIENEKGIGLPVLSDFILNKINKSTFLSKSKTR
ncbi:hypothetical protein ECP030529311_3847, partial [Escherichia coli p0305293.11]